MLAHVALHHLNLLVELLDLLSLVSFQLQRYTGISSRRSNACGWEGASKLAAHYVKATRNLVLMVNHHTEKLTRKLQYTLTRKVFVAGTSEAAEGGAKTLLDE